MCMFFHVFPESLSEATLSDYLFIESVSTKKVNNNNNTKTKNEK